ncbi:MAG: DUF3293 domain-containing protein [Gemmatimonadaceae bacterium]
MLSEPERIDPDWSHYPDTILTFLTDPEVRIDLREILSDDVIEQLKTIGLDHPFAIVTAFDPNGLNLPARENEQRQRALEEKLAASRCDFVRVDARSPDGAHSERSIAVSMSQQAAVDLARELGQVAIFWFDGKAFWIVAAVAETGPLMLPRTS